MAVVTGSEDLILGHPGSLPPSAALSETFDGHCTIGPMLSACRNEMGYGLAVTRDGDGLTTFYYPEQLS